MSLAKMLTGGVDGFCAKPKLIVRIAYSDESGTDGKSPFVVVGAVVVEVAKQLPGVIRRIQDIKLKYPQYSKEGSEIKASKLFARLERDQNKEILNNVLSIPLDYRVPIFCGVARVTTTNTPILQAMATIRCALKIDSYLEQITDKVLWIADRNNATERQVKEAIKMTRKLGILPGVREFRLYNIIDTIYTGNSHESELLQLADACTYTISAQLRQKKGIDTYYRIIESQTLRRFSANMKYP